MEWWPVQIMTSLTPLSYSGNGSQREITQYACTYHLEHPPSGNSDEKTWTVSQYWRKVGNTSWGAGAVPKEDDCRTCSGGGGAGSGDGSGWSKAGGPGYTDSAFGNPILISNLEKIERSADWVSPRDSRFEFARIYSSTDEGRRSASGESFGVSWWSALENTIWQTGNKHMLYREVGSRFEFFGSTNVNYTSKMADHPFRMTRDSSTAFKTSKLYVNNGKGRVETYTEYLNFSTSTSTDRYLKLSAVQWPDGYKITITRNAQNRIASVSDNLGQRAEFSWLTQSGSAPQVHVVDKILIDTDFNGTTLQPDIEIAYTYEFDPVFAFVTKMKKAETRDLSSGQVIRSFEYGYAPMEPLPALLTEVKDGRLGSNGLTFAYANFTYGTQAGSGDIIATSSSHAGGADTFTASMSSNDDVTVVNPLGKQTVFDIETIDGRKRIVGAQGVATASCLGTAISASYSAPTGSAKGYVYSRVERNGSTTTFSRDSRGLALTKTEDALGTNPRVTSYTWHSTLRVPLTRTTAGLLETFTYNSDGLLLTYSQKDTKAGSPSLNQVRTWTYGYTTLASGLKVLTSIDGPGLAAEGVNDVSTFTYTSKGELITSTDPMGLVTTVLARNAQGQPTLVEGPDKNRWSFTYDLSGRVLTSGFAAPGQTAPMSSYTYDIVGQLTSYVDPAGNTWNFTYDQARRLTKVVSPSGDTTNYSFDAAGNVTRQEHRNGSGPVAFWEETEFDELSRLLKTIGAQGQQWTFSHDKEDNLLTETDPLNQTTTSAFDALNRMIGTTDRENYVTGQSFNPADQLTEFTDPRQIKTTFTYNGFGEVISEVSADRGTIGYTYDRRGLVKSRTDGRGITINYSYDNAGRITLIDQPAGGVPDHVFTWDQPLAGGPADAQKGKVARITDGIIQTTFSEQASGTAAIQSAYTALYPQSRSYAMLDETSLTGRHIRTVYPSGSEVLYSHNLDGEISAIRWKTGATTVDLVTSITYKPNGPIASMLYGDGFTQTRSYDTSYRLTGISDANGSTFLRNVTMGYEARDNLTSITDTLVPANSETFGYTPRESLASAQGPYGQMAFTYDGVGNRVTYAVNPGSGLLTDTYSYPTTSNRLSGIALGAGGSRAFTYDAAGNVTLDNRTGGGYSYTYDSAGRMASFSINGVLQAEYKYDFAGRQAIRKLYGANPATIHSVFDAQGRRIAEYNEATGALIREYVWMGWEPVTVIEGGVVYYIRADYIGRPVFATNASGAKVWSVTYTPFGSVHTSSGLPVEARFPGQWYQAEPGLHQNWMRDYDPTTGRYIEADPLGLVDGASVYGYVRGNPGRWIDPRGEETAWGGNGPISFPAPVWPGESYPGELGGSMLDAIEWFNENVNPLVPVVEYCRDLICQASGSCQSTEPLWCTYSGRIDFDKDKSTLCMYECPDGSQKVYYVDGPNGFRICSAAIPFK